jgi:coenzyme F420 hydrogenase subunit beta
LRRLNTVLALMASNQIPQPDLFGTVVRNGFCIGCGACAAFDPAIRIAFDGYGRYVATRKSAGPRLTESASRVCPFADGVPTETDLAREVFGEASSHDSRIGQHVATYAGWVLESDYRAKGSSGGMVSWLLVELLKLKAVDYVVHVMADPSPKADGPLYRFSISSCAEEVRKGAKSRYYPVEMSGVIAEMLRQPGRYAVVGVPCFIKALRLACRESAVLKQRLTLAVGIVCGHLKSKAFAEMFAWQCGLAPSELRAIDFRTKLSGRAASDYAVTVTGQRDGLAVTATKPTSELFGSNWGLGFFKYKACDFCDDVLAEAADVSLGDAWLPEYVCDSNGTNVVVVRSNTVGSILARAEEEGRLHLEPISAERVVASQAGGFRHRREGLAYRLAREDANGRWRPTKRVNPSVTHLSWKLRRIHELRKEVSETSHAAFASARQKGDFTEFIKVMQPLTRRYMRKYETPLVLRALGKLKRSLVSICERLSGPVSGASRPVLVPKP